MAGSRFPAPFKPGIAPGLMGIMPVKLFPVPALIGIVPVKLFIVPALIGIKPVKLFSMPVLIGIVPVKLFIVPIKNADVLNEAEFKFSPVLQEELNVNKEELMQVDFRNPTVSRLLGGGMPKIPDNRAF